VAVLSEKAGVPYDAPGQEAPQKVVDLVLAGDRVGAQRKYRELTGSGVEEAQEAISKL
jgi:ribosomal protein L7/L12